MARYEHGTGKEGPGYGGNTQKDKDRAAGRHGTDTPAQNTNKAANNHTNESRRGKKK